MRESDPSLKNISSSGSSAAGKTTDNGPSWLVGETSSIQVLTYCASILKYHKAVVQSSLSYHIVEKCDFVQVDYTKDIIPLADANVQSSGAKAASCGRLASLAAISSKGSALVPKAIIFVMKICSYCKKSRRDIET